MKERQLQGIGYIAGDWPLDPQKATIVFIHGAGGSGTFWQNQLSALSARVNALAVDLPGHGRSDGAGCDDIGQYSRAVADFLVSVAAPQPVVCGFSMGGAIALQLIKAERQLLKAAILSNTGAVLKVAPMIFESIDKDYEGFVQMIGKLSASKKTDPEVVRPFQQDWLRCPPAIARGDFQACDRFDMTDQLSSIDLPALVVTAGEDRLTPAAFGELLAERIPNASRVHIRDAGHIAPIEKPAEFNAAIVEFLDRQRL
jgi:pimeloyl-ACP methyl ester carboxylesterase